MSADPEAVPFDPAWLKASGNRILKGAFGVVHHQAGLIAIAAMPRAGVDEHLIRILESAVDDLGIQVNVNSTDSGGHVTGSRHYRGCAVDINKAGPLRGPQRQATLSNHSAVALVHWLTEHGFCAGHENGPYPAALFGPSGSPTNLTRIDHSSHMHVSLHPPPGADPGEFDGWGDSEIGGQGES